MSRSPEGSSEEFPFVVDGIKASEFRHFLQITLPSVTEDPKGAFGNVISKEQWISVLKISTSWRCLSLRKLAIDKLEYRFGLFIPSLSHLDPVEKIVLGRRHYVSRWVVAGYAALVKQGNVTDLEMEAIGAVTSFKLLRIILDNLAERLGDFALDDKVKGVFQAEVQSIAKIEKSYYQEQRAVTAWRGYGTRRRRKI